MTGTASGIGGIFSDSCSMKTTIASKTTTSKNVTQEKSVNLYLLNPSFSPASAGRKKTSNRRKAVIIHGTKRTKTG